MSTIYVKEPTLTDEEIQENVKIRKVGRKFSKSKPGKPVTYKNGKNKTITQWY